EIHTKYFGLKYDLKELKHDEVATFLEKRDFKAINVTIPYKQTVIPHLDFVSEVARKIGAVNVIVNNGGKLCGYNTDYLGLKGMIEKSGVCLLGKNVLILGDGATSKTALAVAVDLGCKRALRVSRKQTEGTVNYDEAGRMTDTQVIINTTPVGMHPNIENQIIDISSYPKLEGVFDVIYNPICSALVLQAKKRGITACGGLYMLVGQAVFAAEKFKDIKIETEKIDSIYNEILNDKQNIVLIGMPSSGKTTVGKFLAEELGREFIDTDDIIKSNYGDITAIFEEKGESGFRVIESEVIKEVASLQGKVIATGGGAVLNGKNVDLLKLNGKIYFLDRPLESLVATDDRPLSRDKEMLKKRYNERYGIYCDCCDKQITVNTTPGDAVNSIKEDFLK
ncbi:MAG: hypothetical protein IKT44_05825, partial [Clostridia bacterium]|nr:hypothetical protein [Clostridia bacterium]